MSGGGQPEISRKDPAAGLVPARDFNPLVERFLGDVAGPGVEQPAKVVVPLLAGQLALKIAPGLVGFDNVADAEEMHGAIVRGHVRIADADGFGFVVFRAPRPLDLTLRAPLAGAVEERPLCMRIADVLEKDELPGRAVRCETAIRMFTERRRPLPRWLQ